MRFLTFLAASATMFAHDMWIEPASFSPEPGQIVSVRLKVGQDFLGDPLPRIEALVNQFAVFDKEGRKPVIGHEGQDPAGLFRVAAPGMHVVGYFSNSSTVEETAEKFNQYVKEEGLDFVAAVRAQRKETSKPVREQFSRCAKSLVLSGTSQVGQGDRFLGFPLELVAESNPYSISNGELPVRLIFQNRPLAGALVVAMNRANPMQKITVRTDAAGRVRLRLNGPGMWLIKAVQAIPAAQGSNADWSSFWASLTFEISGRKS